MANNLELSKHDFLNIRLFYKDIDLTPFVILYPDKRIVDYKLVAGELIPVEKEFFRLSGSFNSAIAKIFIDHAPESFDIKYSVSKGNGEKLLEKNITFKLLNYSMELQTGMTQLNCYSVLNSDDLIGKINAN